jgi:hypothetical protein
MNDEGTYPKDGFLQGNWSGKPCPHCGGNDIVSGLEFNLNAEVGPFGLSYKAVAFFRGTEKLYAVLCRGCGTVMRIYVNDPKRNWIQRGDKKTHP